MLRLKRALRSRRAHHGETENPEEGCESLEKTSDTSFVARVVTVAGRAIFEPAVVHYNSGCAYALLGELDGAAAALSRAIDNGFNDRAQLERDPDLAALRAAPAWNALAARLNR